MALSDSLIGSGSAQDVLPLGSSIYVGGSFRTWASGDTSGRWKVEKRNAVTGALEKFGGGAAPLGTVVRLAADLESLYVVGGEFLGVHPDGQPDVAWRIEKRKLRTGALVRGFGSEGVLTLNFSPFSDWCRGVIVDGTDLYLIGEDSIHQDPQGTVAYQWRIEKRSATTGAPDPAFGAGGAVTVYETPLPGNAYAGEPQDALLVDGSLVIVGTENGHWRIEKRDRLTGALDPSFGSGGLVIRDPFFNLDEARRVVSDGTFLYVAGTQEGLDGKEWRIEKFRADTGETETSFGTSGIVVVPGMAWNSMPVAMAEVSGALYVGGMHSSNDSLLDIRWRVLKLLSLDGSPVASFGTAGIVESDPTPGSDILTGLATDGQALYLAGTQGDNQWRIEKRAR